MSPSLDIVVAHHNEDLLWLKDVAQYCTVYVKGSVPGCFPRFGKIRQLPNIGREGHTYLYHIILNYDKLADITIFVQGAIDDHVACSITDMTEACSRMDGSSVLIFPSSDAVSRELVRFDEWEGIQWACHPCLDKWATMGMKSANSTPAEYFAQYLGNGSIPLCLGYVSGAVFAVPRRLIQSRSLKFYERLMEAMFLGTMKHVNPETGFYMERFWLAMWQPDEYVCWSEHEVSATERNSLGVLAKGRWRPLSRI